MGMSETTEVALVIAGGLHWMARHRLETRP